MKNNRVSTIGDFIKEINEMPQPVGIILFGADSEFKKDVYRRCTEQLQNVALGRSVKGKMPSETTERALSDKKDILIVMDGDPSGHQTCRVAMATKLKDSGAKSVVGIYAKIHKTPYCKHITDWTNLHWQVENFLQHPPTGDEFDRLLVMSEKRRGSHV